MIYLMLKEIVTKSRVCNFCQGTVKPYSKKLRCSSKSRRNLGKLVSDVLDFNDIIIGGDGIIVEIDEEKLDKVKFHRGHRVDCV
ncbi:hypothetical protein HZS_2199 [Henneguya salminicola]|nr:hypothetical protein HZS_2199 [Henneguya salminicola]